jgi:hypothetical protein
VLRSRLCQLKPLPLFGLFCLCNKCPQMPPCEFVLLPGRQGRRTRRQIDNIRHKAGSRTEIVTFSRMSPSPIYFPQIYSLSFLLVFSLPFVFSPSFGLFLSFPLLSHVFPSKRPEVNHRVNIYRGIDPGQPVVTPSARPATWCHVG